MPPIYLPQGISGERARSYPTLLGGSCGVVLGVVGVSVYPSMLRRREREVDGWRFQSDTYVLIGDSFLPGLAADRSHSKTTLVSCFLEYLE